MPMPKSIGRITMLTYTRQSSKDLLVLLIYIINIILFALFPFTEFYLVIPQFSYSASFFIGFQFFVSFFLGFVSTLALVAVTKQKPSWLLIFTRSSLFLIFVTSVTLISLRLYHTQVMEILAQLDDHSSLFYRSTKSDIEKNLESFIHVELVRMGWEIISCLIIMNYYESMVRKRKLAIIYTVPQHFVTWEDEVYHNDKSKSISTSFSKYKLPPYAQLI